MIRREPSPEHPIVMPVDATGVEVLRDVEVRPDQSMDIYRPAERSGLRPAVLFVYGDAPPEYLRHAREWGQYRSWGEAIAAAGLCAVVFDHVSSEERTRMDAVVDDIQAAIEAVRARGATWGIDPDRLAVWTASAGVPYGVTVAMTTVPPVRCIVAYYGPFDLRGWPTAAPVPEGALAGMSPVVALESMPLVTPMLIVKAALDHPAINATIDAFVARALDAGSPVELLLHEDGRHAFDVLDDDDRSRELIGATIDFMKRHLVTGPAGSERHRQGRVQWE